LSLYPSKTEFLIFGLPQQLSELNNLTIHFPNNLILSPVDSVRHPDVSFDKNLSLALHISVVSKSYFHIIRDLRIFVISIEQVVMLTLLYNATRRGEHLHAGQSQIDHRVSVDNEMR